MRRTSSLFKKKNSFEKYSSGKRLNRLEYSKNLLLAEHVAEKTSFDWKRFISRECFRGDTPSKHKSQQEMGFDDG